MSVLPLTGFLDPPIRIGINFTVTTGFVGHFVAGRLFYGLSFWEDRKRMRFITLLAVYLVASAGTAYLTYLRTSQAGEFQGFFYRYVSPTVVVASFSLFLLLWFIPYDGFLERFPPLRALVTRASSATLSIYLVHVVFLRLLQKSPLFDSSDGLRLILAVPLAAICAIILSYILVEVLHRIPVVKAIT
jgi:surface polysaccharide O-acyltransferase-like enzyme